MAREHAVDAHEPVHRDQNGGEGKQPQGSPVADGGAKGCPAACDAEQHHAEDQRPDDPVGDDLDGPGRREEWKVQRQDTPDQIRTEAESQAGATGRGPVARFMRIHPTDRTGRHDGTSLGGGSLRLRSRSTYSPSEQSLSGGAKRVAGYRSPPWWAVAAAWRRTC